MKNHVGALVLLLPLTLTGAGGAFAADAPAARCSVATLHGTYLFANEGSTVSGKGRGPNAIAGQEFYDGHGNVRTVATSSTNGKIARFVHGTAKYTINPDCTGSVILSDGVTLDLFVAPDGSQFAFVSPQPGTVSAGFEYRVTARRVGD